MDATNAVLPDSSLFTNVWNVYKKKTVPSLERGTNAPIVTPLKYVTGLNKKVIDFFSNSVYVSIFNRNHNIVVLVPNEWHI